MTYTTRNGVRYQSAHIYACGYALCRRYGVPVEQPDFSGVAQQYGELEAPERLNMLRETCDLSKVLNRSIERALDLRQRSRAKNAVLTR